MTNTSKTSQDCDSIIEDLEVAEEALAIAVAIAADTDDFLLHRPSDDERHTPEEIWSDWACTVRLIPDLVQQLKLLHTLVGTREAPEATVVMGLAVRLEQQLADAARLAGLAQAVALESYLWLEGLAPDMRMAAILIDQKRATLDAALDEAGDD